MRAPWRSPAVESPERRILLSPLAVASWVYGVGAQLHRVAYERGLLARRELPCRVVSVGSLTVGGAGKTPTAAWLATRLLQRGQRVAIASRGFGRRGREPVCVVSDGERVLASLDRAGDEALLLAAHSPGVPVLVGSDRGIVGLRAVSAFGTEVLVLDDGFQHHRLARDVEIAILDAHAGLGNRAVLPRGPLRERRSGISRAHAIGVLDGELSERDEAFVSRAAPNALRFRAWRRPSGIRVLRGGPQFPASSLRGMEVGALSGVGSPEGFRRTLERLGARVVAERRFADHHRYRCSDLASLARNARIWLTTEKDAVKLRPEWARGVDIRVLRIELEVEDASADALLQLASSAVPDAVKCQPQALAAQTAQECTA